MTQPATSNRRPRRRVASTRIQPVKSPPLLTSEPTMADILRSVNQVHDCLHSHVEKTEQNFGKVHGRIDELVKDVMMPVGERLAKLEGAAEATARAQVATASALGVKVPKTDDDVPAKHGLRLGTMKPWQGALAGLGVIGSALAGYQVLGHVLPPIWAGLVAASHALGPAIVAAHHALMAGAQ